MLKNQILSYQKIKKNRSLVEYDIKFFIYNNKTTQCTFFMFYKVEYVIHVFITTEYTIFKKITCFEFYATFVI